MEVDKAPIEKAAGTAVEAGCLETLLEARIEETGARASTHKHDSQTTKGL